MDCKALMDVIAALGAVTNLRESCRVFLNMLYSHIPYDRAIIWLLQNSGLI